MMIQVIDFAVMMVFTLMRMTVMADADKRE